MGFSPPGLARLKVAHVRTKPELDKSLPVLGNPGSPEMQIGLQKAPVVMNGSGFVF